MIQLRMHVGVNQSADNGGAKWLNYGYFKCRTHERVLTINLVNDRENANTTI